MVVVTGDARRCDGLVGIDCSEVLGLAERLLAIERLGVVLVYSFQTLLLQRRLWQVLLVDRPQRLQ
jgi:hypothetical protein